MAETTVIYYSDNSLPQALADVCQRYLLRVAGEMPIISVSQKPMALGHNICVGDIGRSLLSLFRQQLIGLEAATTQYVAFAEHDVIYSPEHFQFVPPKRDVFYYNTNFWYLHYGERDPELTNLFSWGAKRRPNGEFQAPQSQLIAEREMVIQAYRDRLSLIKDGLLSRVLPAEPGMRRKDAIGQLEGIPAFLPLLEWASKWKAEWFSTIIPNLDIQHGDNYSRKSKVRVGKKRRGVLPYWGTVQDVLGC